MFKTCRSFKTSTPSRVRGTSSREPANLGTEIALCSFCCVLVTLRLSLSSLRPLVRHVLAGDDRCDAGCVSLHRTLPSAGCELIQSLSRAMNAAFCNCSCCANFLVLMPLDVAGLSRARLALHRCRGKERLRSVQLLTAECEGLGKGLGKGGNATTSNSCLREPMVAGLKDCQDIFRFGRRDVVGALAQRVTAF